MNKTQTYISRSEYDPLAQKEKRVKDPEAMTQAAMKQTELEERFEQWIKGQDKTTTDKLVEIYNRTFNSTVERQIDVHRSIIFPTPHTRRSRASIRKSVSCEVCKEQRCWHTKSAREKP